MLGRATSTEARIPGILGFLTPCALATLGWQQLSDPYIPPPVRCGAGRLPAPGSVLCTAAGAPLHTCTPRPCIWITCARRVWIPLRMVLWCSASVMPRLRMSLQPWKTSLSSEMLQQQWFPGKGSASFRPATARKPQPVVPGTQACSTPCVTELPTLPPCAVHITWNQ